MLNFFGKKTKPKRSPNETCVSLNKLSDKGLKSVGSSKKFSKPVRKKAWSLLSRRN